VLRVEVTRSPSNRRMTAICAGRPRRLAVIADRAVDVRVRGLRSATNAKVGGNEGYRCCSRAARGRRSAQQSGGEFALAISATRTGNATVSKSEDAAEVPFSSRPPPVQPGAPPRHEASLRRNALLPWPSGVPWRRRAPPTSGVSPHVRTQRRLDSALRSCRAISCASNAGWRRKGRPCSNCFSTFMALSFSRAPCRSPAGSSSARRRDASAPRS
jgi:hypothetical protein